MVSVAFFTGIILMVSPGIFDKLNRALQREFGIKKRIAPILEDTQFDFVEKAALRNRAITGLLLTLSAFLLLLATS